MSRPTPEVSCLGMGEELAALLVPLAAEAIAALDLAADISALRICGDDLPGDSGAWYRLDAGPGPDLPPVLTIYCHPDCFGEANLKVAPDSATPRAWEQLPAPKEESGAGETAFSTSRAEVFLHHHLLTARDVVRGEVTGRDLPAGLAEAFTEAWAVCVDGRLARMGLPCFSLGRRRGRFARLFSPAGILMPDHWQIFQALWDGALPRQQDVLGAIKRLPGL